MDEPICEHCRGRGGHWCELGTDTWYACDQCDVHEKWLAERARRNPPKHTIQLTDYQVTNLKSLIEACGYSGKERIRNPLWVANTGDWIGEIYNMLPDVDYPPNATPVDLASRAIAFKMS